MPDILYGVMVCMIYVGVVSCIEAYAKVIKNG